MSDHPVHQLKLMMCPICEEPLCPCRATWITPKEPQTISPTIVCRVQVPICRRHLLPIWFDRAAMLLSMKEAWSLARPKLVAWGQISERVASGGERDETPAANPEPPTVGHHLPALLCDLAILVGVWGVLICERLTGIIRAAVRPVRHTTCSATPIPEPGREPRQKGAGLPSKLQ